MKIALLITGDEILAGDLRDSNSYYLIQQFISIGLKVEKVVIMGDNLDSLAKEIKVLAQNFELLIINGGLGPTVDDYTSEALSIAFASSLVENQLAIEQVTNALKKKGRAVTKLEKKQAMLPKIANPIINETGIAPGIFLQYQKCKIFCTPGVPSELYSMFSKQILPQFTDHKFFTETLLLRCFGVGEANAQQIIQQNNVALSNKIKLGFRAHFPYIDIKLTIFDRKNTKFLIEKHQALQRIFCDYFITSQMLSLEVKIVRLFQEKKKTLVFAESCTGGLLSSKIASVSGASDVLQAGFVLYQNEQKILHGVSKKALAQGAVSQAVVAEMLVASLSKTNASFGASVSGVAGPTGGSAKNPVGSVWIAWGSKKKINTKHLFIPRDRVTIQELTAYTVLDLLRRELLELPHLSRYSFEKQV